MGERHRVRLGDRIQLVTVGSLAATLFARVLIEFDNGRLRFIPLSLVSGTTRAVQDTDVGPIEANGRVVRAVVTGINQGRRGQNFVELVTLNENREVQDILISDYLHNLHQPTLDQFVDPGPGGGGGFYHWRTVVDDVTPVDVIDVLASANAFKRVYGYVWYYHASVDVADRTLVVSVRAPGLGLPTGFSIAEVVGLPHTGAITLSADQEGILYAMGGKKGSGFASTNDNATLATSNTTSVPSPFPLDVEENDLVEIFFDVGAAEAADRHSIFVLEEEWINV